MKAPRLLVVVVASLGAAAPAPAQVRDTLVFCVAAGDLPMSDRGSPAGFDVDVARALAAKLGASARLEWLRPHAESLEQAVLEGRCDAAPGAVVDAGAMAGDRDLPGLARTEAYYEAGYALLRRPDARSAAGLEELDRGNRLAVERESIAAYSLRQRGHEVHVMPDARAVIRAIAEGRESYGYLWGPLAAWLLRDRSDVVLDGAFQPVERWRFAVALRRGDRALCRRLNEAIRALSEEGSIAAIFAAYGARAPSPSGPAADDGAPR